MRLFELQEPRKVSLCLSVL